MNGWIGVDLDGTLAVYDGWKGLDHIGDPIPRMVKNVQQWLSEGKEVRIFTARVSREFSGMVDRSEMPIEQIRKVIEDWCEEHIGKVLPITCIKDFGMVVLWDDRCIQVVTNTGLTVLEHEHNTATS